MANTIFTIAIYTMFFCIAGMIFCILGLIIEFMFGKQEWYNKLLTKKLKKEN